MEQEKTYAARETAKRCEEQILRLTRELGTTERELEEATNRLKDCERRSIDQRQSK